MLSFALEKQSWLHRIPATIKLLILVIVSAVLFPIDDLVPLFGAFSLALALTASLGRVALKRTFSLIVPLLIMIAMLNAFHIIFDDIERGISISLKLLALILLANVVTLTTALSEMMGLVQKLLAPFTRFGLNAKAVSIAMGLVVRCTPVLLERASIMKDAFRARSMKSANWKIIPPIAMSAIDDAECISDAVRARGGINKQLD